MRGLWSKNIKRVLCIGAHSDDIEIGAGGTILTMLANRPDLEVHWVVFSAGGARAREARESARRFLAGCNKSTIDLFEFRDGYFPYLGAAVKDQVELLKAAPAPDLILTHHRRDLHQDHRILGELTWNTFRNHLILEYEIPKYDGGLTSPNAFVEIDEAVLHAKIDILLEVFQSQRRRRWFSRENFEALSRLRGMECNASSGLAEGFHCAKARLIRDEKP